MGYLPRRRWLQMDVSPDYGPQPVEAEISPTVSFTSGPATYPYTLEPGTRNYHVHPSSLNFVVELNGGRIVDLTT